MVSLLYSKSTLPTVQTSLLIDLFFWTVSSCCASKFTWASTSDSEAQEARDKHNCRSCGTLVCDPCSRNCVSLPSIGLNVTVRCCDRCYNDIDGILTGAPRIGESNTAGDTNEEELPTRERQRRSAVVDDLAARIQTTPMSCS